MIIAEFHLLNHKETPINESIRDSSKLDVYQKSFSRSPENNDLLGSTTINSSDFSALKINLESPQIKGISELHVKRLKKKIYKLEQNNKQLETQVKEWREKYYEMKDAKTTVKDDTVDQIYSKMISLQENHFSTIEKNFKSIIKELTTKLNKAVEEKNQSDAKVKDLSEEISLLKTEHEQTNNSYEKKERLMKFAL